MLLLVGRAGSYFTQTNVLVDKGWVSLARVERLD